MSNNSEAPRTSKSILFIFSQIFNYSKDFEDFIGEERDFPIELEREWLKFWLKHGEDITLETWKRKYRDFIADESGDFKETEAEYQISVDSEVPIKEKVKEQDYPANEKLCGAKKEEETDKAQEIDLTSGSDQQADENYSEYLDEKRDGFEETSEITDWQTLWNYHYEEQYSQNFNTFSQNFYFTKDLYRRAFQAEEEEYKEETDITHFDQLKALGLPTKFGSRNRARSTRKKQQLEDYLPEWYSEDEIEEEDDNSDDFIEENLKKMDLAEERIPTQSRQSSLLGIKKKKKRKNKNAKLINIPSYILEDKMLLKYWYKRYSLFSRFDQGIQLDRESWFSVTPEKIAAMLAKRLKCDVIVDAFCGSGGNSIQFAKTCNKVIAIDIDATKIQQAKNNARIYGVENKIEFIIGDFLQLYEQIKADIVFLSPPWGGPQYNNSHVYDIETSLLPIPASQLVQKCRNISEDIAIYLPRNSDRKQIIQIAGAGKQTEIEENFLNTKLVAVTAFYGSLVGRNT